MPRTLNLNVLDEISLPNEYARSVAYQHIANKYLSRDIRQFMAQLKNNSVRENSPSVLKYVLQIAKKHISNGVGDL